MRKKRVYESIMAGLNEAVEDAQSEKPILKRNEVTVKPVTIFNADEVKKIKSFDSISKAELGAMLQHSYEQSLRGEGKPFDDVFDELEKSLS